MTPTCPKCHGTNLEIIHNETHGLFVMCKTTGCWTFPVDAGHDDFHDVVQRYERAFIACEQDGDDSDEALTEQELARGALLSKLRRYMNVLSEIGNAIGAPTMNYAPETERKELLRRVDLISKLVQDALLKG